MKNVTNNHHDKTVDTEEENLILFVWLRPEKNKYSWLISFLKKWTVRSKMKDWRKISNLLRNYMCCDVHVVAFLSARNNNIIIIQFFLNIIRVDNNFGCFHVLMTYMKRDVERARESKILRDKGCCAEKLSLYAYTR